MDGSLVASKKKNKKKKGGGDRRQSVPPRRAPSPGALQKGALPFGQEGSKTGRDCRSGGDEKRAESQRIRKQVCLRKDYWTAGEIGIFSRRSTQPSQGDGGVPGARGPEGRRGPLVKVKKKWLPGTAPFHTHGKAGGGGGWSNLRLKGKGQKASFNLERQTPLVANFDTLSMNGPQLSQFSSSE